MEEWKEGDVCVCVYSMFQHNSCLRLYSKSYTKSISRISISYFFGGAVAPVSGARAPFTAIAARSHRMLKYDTEIVQERCESAHREHDVLVQSSMHSTYINTKHNCLNLYVGTCDTDSCLASHVMP